MERRRAGFRLPWTADGQETPDTQDQAAADTAVAEDTVAETATSEATAAEGTAGGAAAEATAADGADDAERAEMETQPPVDTGVTAEATGDAQATPSVAAATAEAATAETSTADAFAQEAGPESTNFLASLVGAMRGVAESSRDASLAELKTVIDERIAALNAMAAEREAELRSKSDADIEAVGEWERAETERIRGEAETKRSERRARLEQELTEHRAASEKAAEEARSRLAQHERDLAAFFAQLGEITDPAAFVAAAKRMPRAPELDDVTATPTEGSATPAAASAMDPRLAALGVTPEEPAAEIAAETAAEAGGETAAASTETTTPETGATPNADANGTTRPEDARLTERLAQLDQRLAAAPAQAATPAAGVSADTSTAIVVKGLGSFGAITSFKQALERVEGVRGVTLSLGPTGEFVYRASHAGDFDLVAAIQALEGPTATIDDTDGTLVVTLSRAR
ncbi:MAG TPA: hypothetical protein VFK61_01505 [Candidatus Limnocylindria bacterium]|nr:hypothetical protein [Candidatus Limnocylindria bacterium]